MHLDEWITLGIYLVMAVLVFFSLLRDPGESKIAWLPNRAAMILDCALNGMLWPILAVKFLLEALWNR